MSETELLESLRRIVGRSHVLTEADTRIGFETDWTGRYSGSAIAVVRPGSTEEVSAVLRACSHSGIAVIPQGGNTGLVGGGVPRRVAPSGGQIVLSTVRFDELGPVDVAARQVTVGAGVSIARWADHARSVGLDAGVDFAARDSATVGGAIATNAGGSRVLRYGTMRSQIVGIEAVLSTGDVVGSLAGLPKETAGMHWPSLLCGSEGTLAVVTRARLRLVPRFDSGATALVALPSVESAVELLTVLRGTVPDLDAVEIILPPALDLVSAHTATGPPVSAPPDGAAVLVDCAGDRDPTDDLVGAIEVTPGVVDSAVATDPPSRRRLIEARDRITEAIAATTAGTTPTFKLDVAVPVTRLAELVDVARAAADSDGCRLIAFGHLAEGNLHLNHLDAGDTERLAETVLAAVADLGGTISAEHGIGMAKARWLPLIRSDADLGAQRALKQALDPAGILNPGVLGR